MTLVFTDELKMMQQMVRQFSQREIAPIVNKMETEHYFPQEVINKMGEQGLMGISIPEKYGGSGMNFMNYVMTIHEISKVSPAIGVILSVHTSVGTNPILEFGTEEQKSRYVTKLATGEYLGAFALTEPSAGSDASNIKLRATDKGDHYILNGSKIFITNGKEADTFVTFAQLYNEVDYIGMSAFIVTKDTPGLSVGKNENKMGLRGTSTVALNFDQCVIDKTQLLGKEGDGFKIAMANLNVGRIGIAAQSLGIAEGALEHAIDYAKERIQFGKPIANQQAISFKLANMKTEVEAAKLLVYQAAHKISEKKSSIKEVSMAKYFASKTAMKTAIEAVQIFGGYGYTEDYPVEQYFRDAKVTEIYEGTNEIQKIVIAKQMMK